MALATLLALKDALNEAIDSVAQEWASHGAPAALDDSSNLGGASTLPTKRCYDASKTAIGAAGMLQVLMKDPRDHVMETAAQYLEARALHAASLARIPDILQRAESEGKQDGLNAEEIAAKTGYDVRKCDRFMRLLATSHIFRQTGPHKYANNRSSAVLVDNAALSNYVDLYGSEWFAASTHFVSALSDDTHDVKRAAFTQDRVYNTQGTDMWQYNDDHPVRHDMFATAMAGSAQGNTQAVIEDYPWAALGKGTLVDVGGGVGTLSFPLLKAFSDLSLVIQDRASVLAQAANYWKENFASIPADRVQLQEHDFFTTNPVRGAKAYMLRYIMDDWNDVLCEKILSGIRESMGTGSRVLIVEALVTPSYISDVDVEIQRAPPPLLPNYGVAQRFVHCRDMNMMTLINGTERSHDEMKSIVERAGLQVKKVWVCRGALYITECVLKE
ncbi:O-methyltransferase-domain-containing protein [Schizophyllum amplum]|uniref:O-methyltransferase-domain-containing protein n=1 Tax=Schizophyllum amplum TaxID=97359 RepID=A0A550CY07_9AGAR|nr:O-methyltransferase-domain-containing protein [Auriculariopsis ampla]